jgi:hypothetical protein
MKQGVIIDYVREQPCTIPEIASRIGKIQGFYVDFTHMLSNQRFQLRRPICHSPLVIIKLKHLDTIVSPQVTLERIMQMFHDSAKSPPFFSSYLLSAAGYLEMSSSLVRV